MTDVLMKEACKEALKEWLDEKYAQVGRWTLGTLSTGVIGALVYFILWTNGWQKVVK